MATDEAKRLSKFLSLILRHDPARIGLSVDAGGWARLSDIVEKAGFAVTGSALAETVRTSDKQRFALSGDGLRIRANQGHSFPVDLGLEPVSPPDLLFHGTAEKTLDTILAEGLKPMRRQHVHLSKDRETAAKVGQRHGRPVVLIVEAGLLVQTGQPFYLSANGVWLTGPVAPEFLKRPE